MGFQASRLVAEHCFIETDITQNGAINLSQPRDLNRLALSVVVHAGKMKDVSPTIEAGCIFDQPAAPTHLHKFTSTWGGVIQE